MVGVVDGGSFCRPALRLGRLSHGTGVNWRLENLRITWRNSG